MTHPIFIDVIRHLFPDVPCLFLYRDPSEVLVSSLSKHPMGQARLKGTAAATFMLGGSITSTSEMSYLDYFKSLGEQYFLAVLKSFGEKITYLNYNQLCKQNLAKILQYAFHYTSAEAQLTLMQGQFNYYSKDDKEVVQFTSDIERKQKAITPDIKKVIEQSLATLYYQLENSDNNLVKWL